MVTLGALAIRDLQWGGGSDLWNVSKAKFAALKEVNFHSNFLLGPMTGNFQCLSLNRRTSIPL